MDLNALKSKRKGLRIAFTLCVNKIEAELSKEASESSSFSVLKVQIMDKFQRLDECQTAIFELILEQEDGESLYVKDLEESEVYRDRYLELCTLIETRVQPVNEPVYEPVRKFKLPTIELKKFNGEPKDFLSFWSQFKKIHEDNSIADEDKFQYLLQSVEAKSKAERLVLSFPATATNYPKVIEQLKERFGRDDLLVQIYVRDMLHLVMKNAIKGRAKSDLTSLYDELEGKLRALESLGRTQEKYGDFLIPLVESCLPEDVILAWERSRNPESPNNKNSRSLEHLMNFLRKEVQGEEMVLLARSGFTPKEPHYNFKKDTPFVNKVNRDPATASALISLDSGKRFNNCIFCDKPHPSEKCFAAKKMSLDDKRKVLIKKGACFSCLKKASHLSKVCNFKHKLNCSLFNNNSHFEIMCPKQEKEIVCKAENSLSNCSRSESVFLQTLCVVFRCQGHEKQIRALYDSASQSSYVSEKLINLFTLFPLRSETVIHALFGGEETKPKEHKVFAIEVSDLNRTYSCGFEVLSEKKICGLIPKIIDKKVLTDLKKRKITLSDSFCDTTEIDLLIGADVMGKLLTENIVELDSGLTAVESKLGWTVIGKQIFPGKDNFITTVSMHVGRIPLHELWELEVLGISDPTGTDKSENDLSDYKEKMKILPSGRYEVELPWRYDSMNLHDNMELTWKRHEKMINKLKGGNYFDDYKKVFLEWEEMGVVERVPRNELSNNCHYLPHRPVLKLNSETTKIRPVFDASASQRGKVSLNECLYKGINLLEMIPDILDRFRTFPIGVSADIEKAFLMLSVAPKDRDFLRFFFPGSNGQEIYRHCRVVFGVCSSPYLLNASLMHLLENYPPECNEIAQKLKMSFYVDNLVTGVFNANELEPFIEQTKNIMSKGCFNLRGFESNVVCKNVDKHSGSTSVLGIKWNLDNDTLSCCIDLEPVICESKITKRVILSIVQRIFDPIGLLAPTTLLPKLLLQNLWKMKMSWDSELPPNIISEFVKWYREIFVLKDVTLPRYMFINSSSELHIFVDACKGAYAACVFVRSIIDDEVKVVLVRAKSRVTPLKTLSIPRLELMACNIGARLLNSIMKALDFGEFKVTFWSDSTTALWWIKESGNWSVFVTNRVKEIRNLTKTQSWKHIPGKMNISDLLSRGCSPQKMLNSRWWEGPAWLRENPENWPTGEICSQPADVDLERKRTKVVNVDLAKDTPLWILNNISNYDKMIKVFAWVLRFVNNSRKSCGRSTDVKLSVLEIENSEKCLIRVAQRCFLPEPRSLNFVTFKDDDDILRVQTKITNRADEKPFLYPVVLPDKCQFTKLLIYSVHVKNNHAGIHMMQTLIREDFWIIKARKSIKNVLYNCVTCKRFKARALNSEPTPLPPDRVADCVAFEIVGVDLAGPLILKTGEKVWISLFTCAVFRAIHLELVNSLTTDAFLMALRRFIARRGRPATIYCDNGTNFRGAFNDFSRLDWDRITKETPMRKIRWKFIPPTAAWWGGWWERLVRIIKELLRRTLGKSVLTQEELSTVICECENVINSRPLTYVSEDPQDLVPLTPAMFLRENHCSGVIDIDQIDSQKLSKRIKYRNKLFNDLRKRFRKEYLGELVQRYNERPSREPRINEIVLIGDDNKKRLFWPIARIIELIPGRDGNIRTVKLQMQNGTVLRPVQRIYPLEIQSSETCVVEDSAVGEESGPEGASDVKTSDDVILKRFTSSGRCVKTPKRLDLFNYECCKFETLPKSQRGEYVTNAISK